MSKSVKTIVSVVAAIAIPFAAPAIASSIGLSAAIGGAVGSATAGSVIGGAVTGAALGAAKGAIFGEDVGRSALMGGLSGGVAGYAAAPASGPAGGVAGGTGITAPTAGAGASPYALSGGADLAAMGGGAGLSAPNAGLSGAMDYSLAAGTQLPTAGLNPAAAATGFNAGLPSFANALGSASGAGAPQTFAQALGQVPQKIAARFTDPEAMADLTLRAAGQLAGSALAGSGLSSEEQALLNAQAEELRMLQQANRALFNQRLEQAQALAGDARYFDPEYFGLQSARRAQTQSAVAKRAGLRGLTGERREAEARRYDIEAGRRTGTAYDVGFGSAIQPRIQTQMAGLSAMPTGFPSSAGAYAQLSAGYEAKARRQRQTQSDIGELFGSLTGGSAARSRG